MSLDAKKNKQENWISIAELVISILIITFVLVGWKVGRRRRLAFFTIPFSFSFHVFFSFFFYYHVPA